jgi:hypothetical protein
MMSSMSSSSSQDRRKDIFLDDTIVEEYEQYESSGFVMIDPAVADAYATVFETISIYSKVLIYRLLSHFDYDLMISQQLHHVLTACPINRLDWLLCILYSYIDDSKRLNSAIFLTYSLPSSHMFDLCTQIRDDNVRFFIDIFAFSSLKDKRLFLILLEDLSLQNLLDTIAEYASSHIQHECKLCFARRVDILEHNLTQDDYVRSKRSFRTPGALTINEYTEVWTANDETNFVFDYESNRITYNDQDIDLVNACDACIYDIYSALSIHSRNDNINHLPPEQRLKVMAAHHVDDQHRAQLIEKISSERIKRRTKEWIESILTSYHINLKQEEEEQRLEAEKREAHEQLMAQKQQQLDILHSAFITDKKWRKNDRRISEKGLKSSQLYSSLKYHPGYSKEAPKVFEREHPLSWEWKAYDVDGTPLTKKAVEELSQGVASSSVTSMPAKINLLPINDALLSKHPNPNQNIDLLARFAQLSKWRENAMKDHHKYLSEQEEKVNKERQRKLEEHEDYLNYIYRRNNEIDHKYEIIKREIDEEMNRFHKQRVLDRQQRRLERQRRQEAYENEMILFEDIHSHAHEYYLQEVEREVSENECMREEEAKQRSIDRYWGIDNHEEEIKRCIEIIRESYIKRVREANQTVANTRKLSSKKHALHVAKSTSRMIQQRDIIVNAEHLREEAIRMLRQQRMMISKA